MRLLSGIKTNLKSFLSSLVLPFLIFRLDSPTFRRPGHDLDERPEELDPFGRAPRPRPSTEPNAPALPPAGMEPSPVPTPGWFDLRFVVPGHPMSRVNHWGYNGREAWRIRAEHYCRDQGVRIVEDTDYRRLPPWLDEGLRDHRIEPYEFSQAARDRLDELNGWDLDDTARRWKHANRYMSMDEIMRAARRNQRRKDERALTIIHVRILLPTYHNPPSPANTAGPAICRTEKLSFLSLIGPIDG